MLSMRGRNVSNPGSGSRHHCTAVRTSPLSRLCEFTGRTCSIEVCCFYHRPITTRTQAPMAERPVVLPPVGRLQKLTKEIAECHEHARACRERAERALDPAAKNDFLDQERRWLSLAHSYEFAARLSRFTVPLSKRQQQKP